MSDTKEQDRSPGFYEARGKVRHMLILEKSSKERLKEIAKRFGLTQGEVADVLIANADINALEANGLFRLKAETGGVKKTALAKKMKEATPEQLAEIQRILEGQK